MRRATRSPGLVRGFLDRGPRHSRDECARIAKECGGDFLPSDLALSRVSRGKCRWIRSQVRVRLPHPSPPSAASAESIVGQSDVRIHRFPKGRPSCVVRRFLKLALEGMAEDSRRMKVDVPLLAPGPAGLKSGRRSGRPSCKHKTMTTLMTAEQLALRYAVKARTIGRWRREGRIPFVRLGYRTVRFDPDSCDAAISRFHVLPRWLRHPTKGGSPSRASKP